MLASTYPARAADPADLKAINAEIEKHHDESVHRLQEWIRQPSIAAENRGMTEGCDLMMRMLREAGFNTVTKVPTDGHPGVFATLDAGAPRTVGIYYMYDVKQADPAEWTSPPFEAALVDRPGVGKLLIGRGAVNQKGPEATFLATLHAFKYAGRKLPVNFVFVAEGEEEIGSPHFPQVVHRPDILAALRKCNGVFMPMPMQALDGQVTINLGAKGVVELELVSSGEKWHRGPKQDLHSSNEARVDSPAWHLMQALADAGRSGRPYSRDRRLHRQGPAAERRRESVDPRGRAASERRADQEATGRRALGARRRFPGIAGTAGWTADGEHRGDGRRIHGTGRQDRSCRIGWWRSSICGWCRT